MGISAPLAGGLVILSPLAFCVQLENSFGLPRLLLLVIAAALFFSSLGAWLRASRRPLQHACFVRIAPVLAWLVWITCVTIFRGPYAMAWSNLCMAWVCAAPCFALASGLCNPAAARALLAGAVIVGGAQSAYALLQWFGWDPLFGHATARLEGTSATQRIIGTIGYQNTLGEYLALLLPVALGLGGAAHNRRQQFAWSAVAALIFAAVLLTRSRGALLAALAGVTIWFLLSAHRRLPALLPRLCIATAVSAALLLLVIGLTRDEGDYSLHVRLREAFDPHAPALRQRELIWRVTADMLPGHWLAGQGIGSFARGYLDHLGAFLSAPAQAHLRPFALNVKEAHNDYLQMLAESGAVGLALWLIILSASLRRLLTTHRLSDAPGGQAFLPDHPQSWLHAAIAGSLGAFMVAGLVSFPLWSLPVAPLFWLLLGIGLAPSPAYALPTLSTVRPACTLALLAPLILFCAAVLYGDHRFLRGRNAAAVGDFVSAQREYTRAKSLLPLNPRLRFFQGAAQLAAGQPAGALKHFEASSAGGFADLNLWRNWARAHLELGDSAAAVTLLQRAAATRLLPDAVLPELAGALVRDSRPAEAVAALQQTRAYATETERATCAIARDLISRNQIAPAIDLLTPLAAAPRSSPAERASVLELLGTANLMHANYAAAETHLRNAARCAPDNISVWNNLGAALQLQGRHAEARGIWQAVLLQDPTNAVALRNLNAADSERAILP